MKVTEHLKKAKETLFSYEILPPLKGASIQTIYDTLDELTEFKPPFIDVTYHREEYVYKTKQDGLLEKQSVRKRPGTVGICAAIMNKYNIDTVPHIICGGFNQEETENALIDLDFLGIDNLLVLRGDPINSETYFAAEKGGHKYASDLVKQVYGLNNGISIKLSALYSKYDTLHGSNVKKFLLPRLRDLVYEAAKKDVAVTIDAEEQDRLSLSLALVNTLALDPAIKSWPGLGLAVQAYGKRSLAVVDWLDNLSKHREKMHVRLVKGAYWDHEIKNAQVKGLNGYPVFTNKHLTDLNYLVTAKRLIECESLEASFATHNAHSIASLMSLSESSNTKIEFQRLYGMG